MKNNKNVPYIILIYIALSLWGCYSPKEQETRKYKTQIKEGVKVFNSMCPTTYQGLLSIDSIKYEKDSILAWYLTVNEQYYRIDAINSKSKEAKKFVQSAFIDKMKFNPQTKNFPNLLIKSKSWFKLVLIGKGSHKQAEIFLNPQEIKKTLDNNVKETKDLRNLKSQVYASNMQSPIKIDEITTLDSCGLSNNYLVYCYTIDDNDIDMHALEANSSYLKEEIKKTLNTPQYNLIIKSCIACNKGLMYWYIGRNSFYKIKIIFSIDELTSIIEQSSAYQY